MRSCVLCGASLEQRRADARHCGGACRAEASRLRRILDGVGAPPYYSIHHRLGARRAYRADPSGSAANKPRGGATKKGLK
jgi:hypothetical protein